MEPGRIPLDSLNLGDDEILVKEQLEGVRIAWVITKWNSHIPERGLRDYSFHSWAEIPSNPLDAVKYLDTEATRALHARRSSYRRCRFCRERLPPELMHYMDGWVCHGCAEQKPGVVH